MSTNPKSYTGFQGKYPLLVTFDSDGTPPMLDLSTENIPTNSIQNNFGGELPNLAGENSNRPIGGESD